MNHARQTVLASYGRRIAGITHQPRAQAVADAPPSLFPGGASATESALEISLPPAVMLTLRVAEAAAGVDTRDFLSRAICAEAERIGLPGLADARQWLNFGVDIRNFARVPKRPDRESAEGSPPPRGPSARPESNAKASEDNGITAKGPCEAGIDAPGDVSRLAGGRTPARAGSDRFASGARALISGPWSAHDAGCLAAVPDDSCFARHQRQPICEWTMSIEACGVP